MYANTDGPTRVSAPCIPYTYIPHKETIFFSMQLLHATATLLLELNKSPIPKGTFDSWGGFLHSFAATIPPSLPESTGQH